MEQRTSCRQCSAPLTGKKQRSFCSRPCSLRAAREARAKAPMRTRSCETCAATFSTPSPDRLYCGERCKGWAHRSPGVMPPPLVAVERGCVTCGSSLLGRHRNARYCSEDCRYRFRRPLPTQASCEVCSEDIVGRHLLRARFYSARCEQWRRRHPGQLWPRQRRCARCGTDINQLNPHAIWCGPACAGASAGERRRATLRQLPVERFSRAEVFRRDGWRCHLCRKRINRNLSHPHPMSVSLDHIIPLSVPGSPGHVRSNVAASHLRCNLSKHTSAVGEQLRLIG